MNVWTWIMSMVALRIELVASLWLALLLAAI